MDKLNEAHKLGVVLGLAEVADVVERVDIDVMLLNQPETFNLFLMALMELQGLDVPWEVDPGYTYTSNDPFSFFKIAGIHGLPPDPWFDESFPEIQTGPGYCAHGLPTFAPWHRPYLAMLEQTLFRQVVNIAERFSKSPSVSQEDKEKYTAAAKQFRLPYWDYYRPRGYKVTFAGVLGDGTTTTAPYDYHAPQIFTLPEIMVKQLPDNKLVPMPNPFISFAFPQVSSEDPRNIAWDNSNLNVVDLPNATKQTIRHDTPDGKSNTDEMNALLNKIREDEMRACLIMIESQTKPGGPIGYDNYQTFSTSGAPVGQKWKDKDLKDVMGNGTGSLEDLHGNYHSFLGGYSGTLATGTSSGHMSCVPVAAFDPIFWIHHCQIDRIFAIWQAANGEEHWFNELPSEKSQAMATSNLLPFRKWPLVDETDLENRYWTPNRARDTKVFGYEYPETANGTKGADIRKLFAEKYGWSRRKDPNQEFGTPPKDMQPLPLDKAQAFQYTSGSKTGAIFKPIVPPQPQTAHREAVASVSSVEAKVSQEWFIDVVVERMAANGSYTIFYIIGDNDGAKSGQQWSTLPGFVGVSHIFAAPREACDNCGQQEQQAQLVTGTTPITSLLLDYVKVGALNSMDPADVEPFLVKKLKWHVQTVAGKVLDPRKLDKEHTMKLGISLKTSPMPGQSGEVAYSFYPQIIEQIIANASSAMDHATA